METTEATKNDEKSTDIPYSSAHSELFRLQTNSEYHYNDTLLQDLLTCVPFVFDLSFFFFFYCRCIHNFYVRHNSGSSYRVAVVIVAVVFFFHFVPDRKTLQQWCWCRFFFWVFLLCIPWTNFQAEIHHLLQTVLVLFCKNFRSQNLSVSTTQRLMECLYWSIFNGNVYIFVPLKWLFSFNLIISMPLILSHATQVEL